MYSSPNVNSTEIATSAFNHNLYLLYLGKVCSINTLFWKDDFTWCHVSSMQCNPLSHWGPRSCCASLLDPGTRAFTEGTGGGPSHNEIHSRAHKSQPDRYPNWRRKFFHPMTSYQGAWRPDKSGADSTGNPFSFRLRTIGPLTSVTSTSRQISIQQFQILAAILDRFHSCPIISWLKKNHLQGRAWSKHCMSSLVMWPEPAPISSKVPPHLPLKSRCSCSELRTNISFVTGKNRPPTRTIPQSISH